MNKALTALGLAGASAVALATATPAIAATVPSDPPSGAKTLQTKTLTGNTSYARYSVKSMTPKQVLAYYQQALRADGFRTVNEGGGGSGWSDGWGGGGGGLTAMHNGVYFSVNAGGDGTPTFFEVCYGPNSQVVDNCQNQSQNQSQSKGS
jgi:hypothetical protein